MIRGAIARAIFLPGIGEGVMARGLLPGNFYFLDLLPRFPFPAKHSSIAGARRVCPLCVTRRNRHTGDLGSRVKVKLQDNLHTKLWIMDNYAMIGSPNLTQESLIDNIELLVVRDDRGLEELLRGFVGVKR